MYLLGRAYQVRMLQKLALFTSFKGGIICHIMAHTRIAYLAYCATLQETSEVQGTATGTLASVERPSPLMRNWKETVCYEGCSANRLESGQQK